MPCANQQLFASLFITTSVGMPSGLRLEGNSVNFETLFVC